LAVFAAVFALFGCGAGDKSEASAAVVTVPTPSTIKVAAVTPPALPVTNIVLSLPQGKNLSDVAVVGGDGVVLHDRSQVKELDGINFATVVSNGTGGLNLGIDGVTGDVWSRGAVTLRGANTAGLFNVRGNVTSGSTITLQNNARISGQSKPQTNFATHSLTFPVTLPASYPTATTNLGPDNMNARLVPGTYGDTTLYSRSRLTLAAGTYHFKSLKLEPTTELVLENADEPVYLFIKNEFRYNATITERALGKMAGNLLVGYFGTLQVTFETPFIGSVFAPNATLELATVTAPLGHQGSFYGKQVVETRPDVVVTHRPFPSVLIKRVDVSNPTPCANEPVTVKVTPAQGPSIGPKEAPLLVSIDGKPAVLQNGVATWQFQTFGVGPRKLTVTATQGGGVAESRTIDLDIKSCTQKFPRVVTRSTTTPYEVEFTVTNPEELPGAGRVFAWNFGDGSVQQGAFPYMRHSYVAKLDRSTPELSLEATLTVQRTGQTDVSVKKTIVIPNLYALGAARGFVQPPVTTSGHLEFAGSALEGEFSLRNLESTALTFDQRVVQKHFCDPDRAPVNGAAEAISISVAGAANYSQTVRLNRHDYRQDVCAVSVYLKGKTSDNLNVIVTAHFDTPARPLLTRPITNAAVRSFLNGVASGGLVLDPNRITQDELNRLQSEGRISNMPPLEDQVDGVLDAADDLLGQPCNPDDPAPFPQLSCQATQDWEVTPPLIRNALKGDLIIVSSCETIGGLLRSVTPRQYYSHEGILTRNYYALAESTSSEARLLSSVTGISDGLDGTKLKYSWPGALRQSVTTAFSQKRVVDPDGNLQVIETFFPDAKRCAGDKAASPLLVIHPPTETNAVRSTLQSVADFAFSAETHYRFFGFSQGNIAFDASNNFNGGNYRDPNAEPATVSTSFLWWSLRNRNVPLEGTSFEPLKRGFFQSEAKDNTDEEALGAQPVPAGTLGQTDGLYLYTEEERRAGASYIYNDTYNTVARVQDAKSYEQLGWSADVTAPMLLYFMTGDLTAKTSQREAIAAQFTNCFAFDKCSAPGEPVCPCTMQGSGRDAKRVCPANMTDQQQAACNRTFVLDHPRAGVAVAPDNFLFWDTPYYGYWDYGNYRTGEFRRVHRWAAAAGGGSCGGTVELADGSRVGDARITLQSSTTSTDANGSFRFQAASAGQFEVRAEKEIDNKLLWDTKLVNIAPNGECDPPHLVLTADGPFADLLPVEVLERNVTIKGSLHILDDETWPFSDETRDFAIDTSCTVSPANRHVVLKTSQLTGDDNPCAGAEVSSTVEVSCLLDPDDATNQRVIVTATVSVLEGTDCHGDGSIVDDTQFGVMSLAPTALDAGAATPVRLDPHAGPNYADLSLTISNGEGNLIVINPIKEEQRRQVVFDGSVKILDDDFGSPNEQETFDFSEACYVDPLDPTDVITWSKCVDNEVRVDVEIVCSLVSDDAKRVNVASKVQMFEETTCANRDLDGDEVRATSPLDACEEGCSTVFLNSPNSGDDLVVNNDDEGGDNATLHIQVRNILQSEQP
jgi:hypothetical protein